MRRIVPVIFLASVWLPTGCADDTSADDAGDSGTSSNGDGDGDGDGDSDEPVEARQGIYINYVEASQGPFVPVAAEGAGVGPEGRNSILMNDRDMLVRAHWVVPEDWEPREITARLHLSYADGEELELDKTLLVEGPTFVGDLNRTFWWGLPRENVRSGARFRISLWEAQDTGWEDLPEVAPPEGYFPHTESTEPIGIQDETMQMKVMLVPVIYNNGNNCMTDTSEVLGDEELLQNFIDYLHEANPVQDVLYAVSDTPIVRNTELTSLYSLFQPLQSMRSADNADPNTYYYAVLNACAGGVGDAGGMAPSLAGNNQSAAPERVSVGLWTNNSSFPYDTFVHELGHNQGLPHVACPTGNSSGNDPSYPHHPTGNLGVWALGIKRLKLYSPTASYDYMSYCGPSFTSDYTYNLTTTRVRTLTSWDYGGAPEDPGMEGRKIMNGVIYPDGSEEWWTLDGYRVDEDYTPGDSFTFSAGEEQISMPAMHAELDGGGRYISVMLPEELDFADIDTISRTDGRDGSVSNVAVDVVTLH